MKTRGGGVGPRGIPGGLLLDFEPGIDVVGKESLAGGWGGRDRNSPTEVFLSLLPRRFDKGKSEFVLVLQERGLQVVGW